MKKKKELPKPLFVPPAVELIRFNLKNSKVIDIDSRLKSIYRVKN